MDSKDCWLKDNCAKKHCDDPNGCLILFKLNYLYEEANIPLKSRKKIALYPDGDNTDLNEFKKLSEIQNTILDFVDNGRSLYLHSAQCGNGKTAWSLRLMQTYFNKIWLKTSLSCRGLFISVPQYLLALKDNITTKSTYVQHVKDNIKTADLVIWDDIATKVSTPFEAENLFAAIDARINAGKANIFTSNLSNQELQKALGDRLASRICNLDYNIELHGGDKRHFTEKGE
jgi:DNA replication protein DnaC